MLIIFNLSINNLKSIIISYVKTQQHNSLIKNIIIKTINKLNLDYVHNLYKLY